MPTPKVFEIVFKTEVEADDYEAAVSETRRRVGSKSLDGVIVKYGVIRDDDLFGGEKDIISRHTNHIAVLDPLERQELENIISTLASTTISISTAERSLLLNRGVNILGWHGG